MYDAVYPSGCVNLTFNCNDDGCYHIPRGTFSDWQKVHVGCCAVEAVLCLLF